MHSIRILVCLMVAFILSQQAFAANPDILWQKTLTADTLPIRSIAIAEGKYVAALKGNQIIILDYATGDSVTAFATPKEMYGNDIILGKGGERLYVIVNDGTSLTLLRSWVIETGEKLIDIPLFPSTVGYGNYSSFYTRNSLTGKYIAVAAKYTNQTSASTGGSYGFIRVFNCEDSTIIKIDALGASDVILDVTYGGIANEGGIYSMSFSSSGNYLLSNVKSEETVRANPFQLRKSQRGRFTSLSPNLTSFEYKTFLPLYTISSDDNFLLSGNKLMDVPPTHTFRTLSKTGFVFLPDDNHMLAFKAGGGIAAISNIERDTWEKVFYGDSLTENLIQTNASRSAFATATNQRITLWKIPDTLESARLAANFTMSKDTIQVYDSVTFTNTTFPFKRGTNFEWNFGDASPKTTTPFPVHTFTKAGTFTVTLTVRDTLGATSSISKTVFVDFPAPKARFTTVSDTVYVGNVVVFSNQTTPVRLGTHFTWNFGDGGAFTAVSSPEHQFFSTGNYTVTLIVRDTLGRVDSFSKQVVVIPQIIPSGAVWTTHFHTLSSTSLAYSPDGLLLVSGSNDGYARIWESSTGTLFFTQNVGRGIHSTQFSKDNKSVMVGSYQITNNSPVYLKNSVAKFTHYLDNWSYSQGIFDRKINWDIQPDISSITYLYFNNASLSSALSVDNVWYITGTRFHGSYSYYISEPRVDDKDFGKILLYNFTNRTVRGLPRLLVPYYPIYSASISPDNTYYTLFEVAKLFVFDISNDSLRRQIPTTATSMRFSPDKYHLLTNTGLWDIYDSILVKSVTLPQVFEFHPDGIHVFTIRPDSTIGIFNLTSNSYDYLYPKQPRAFTCLAVAPDGKHIATGDNSGYITVWNVPDTLKSSIIIDFHALSFKRSAVKTSDTVEFANTTLPVNNSFDYAWNFGDGTTSTERAPQHRYLKPGKFTVSLTAYTNGNVVDSITKTQYITVTGPIGVDESQAGLYSTALSITPNPSYAETQIHLTLAQASDYNVRIMDNLGREIARWEEHQSAGEHVILWNENVPSGVYYCTLSVGGEVRTVPFVVVR